MATLFLLEHDPDILFVLDRWLTKNNYQVNCFSELPVMVGALCSLTPDVILLDASLVRYNRLLIICADVRQACPYTKIILLSTTVLPQQTIQECKAEGFIAKPFDLDEVADMVKDVLKKNQFIY